MRLFGQDYPSAAGNGMMQVTMTSSPLFWLGVVGLVIGVALYFIFLPHLEGPNLNEQQADQREWLVQCPNCQRWRLRQAVTSNLQERQVNGRASNYINWYHCFECDHRWHEEYKL